MDVFVGGCVSGNHGTKPNKLTNGKPKIQGAHESTRGSTSTLLKTNMSPLQNGCLENDPASFSGLIFRGEKNVSF